MMTMQETRDADKTIQVLFEISNAVNNAVNLDELYWEIHASLGKIINVDNFAIALYHKDRDSITFPYFIDEMDENYGEIFKISQKESLAAKVINGKRTLLITPEKIEKASRPDRIIGTPAKVWVGAPLRIRDRVLGALVLQNYHSEATYQESDLDILNTVSGFVAMAIERKQAEEEIRENEKITRTLFKISNSVNTTENLEELYRSIYTSLNALIALPNFFLAIVDAKKKRLSFPFFVDEQDTQTNISLGIERYEEGNSNTSQVILTKKPVFLNREALEKQRNRKETIGTAAVIWLGVPLMIKDEVIGVMVVQHYQDPEYFSQKDLDLLTAVSDQVALAIDRKKSQGDSRLNEKLTTTFFSISNAVNTTQDLSELYKSIHTSLNEIIDLTNFIIGLYNKKDNTIQFEYYVDQFDDLMGQSMPLSKGSVGRDVIFSGKPLFLKEEELNRRIEKNQAVGTWPKTWMGVPLKADNQVIGYMAAQSYSDPDLYDIRDVTIFSAVSEQVALAIDRKLSQEEIKQNETLTTTLFNISNAVNTTDNLDDLYASIHHSLDGVIEVKNFAIGIYDCHKDSISYPYYVDETGDVYHEIKAVSSSGILAGDVIRLKHPIANTRDQIIARAKQLGHDVVGVVSEQWLGVPLKIKNEVIGVIVVQHYSNPNYYTQKDIDLLVAVSDQIALAIDRKLSQEEIKESEKLTQTLFNIANAVNTTQDLSELYLSIHTALYEIIDLTNFIIGLYNKKDNTIQFEYYVDEFDDLKGQTILLDEGSLGGAVIHSGAPVFLKEESLKEKSRQINAIGTWARTWMGVPLKADNQVIGYMASQSYSDPDLFDQRDLDIFSAISEQVAMAIDRKRSQEELEQNEALTSTLFKIANAVNATDNLTDMYGSIHNSLGDVIEVRNFAIGIYDRHNDSIAYPYYVDETGDIYHEIRNVSTSGIIAADVIDFNRPVFSSKDQTIARAKDLGLDVVGSVAEQWLGVPLIIKNEVIGVMVVQHYSNPDYYTQEDKDLFIAVSDQIALAIDRKRSQEEIKQNEKLTQTLFNISNAVNTTDNMDDLYFSIFSSLDRIITLPNFFICIVDADKEIMHFPFYLDECDTAISIDFSDDFEEETSSLTAEVIKTKQPQFFTEQMLKQRAQKDQVVGKVPLIWLGVPLIIRDKVLGIMAVQHYTDPDYFTQKEMDLLIAVSDQVALALDRKQAQEIILEREKQIRDLSQQTEELSLVAASIITMKDETEDIFQYVCRAIIDHSDYNRLVMSYFIDEPPFQEILGYEGLSSREILDIQAKEVPKGYYETLFSQGARIGNFTCYLSQDDIGANDMPTTVDDENLDPSEPWQPDDMLLIPMHDERGDLMGILSAADSKSGKKPTQETVRPLEVFSSLISQIFIVRKIQGELKDHKENLEAMVADRTKDLTAEIKERIQIERRLKQAKVQAEAAAQAKLEFLTNMSHEIRTPINGIMGMAELAMEKETDKELKTLLNTIDTEATQLLGIINEILDFSKIDAGKLSLDAIDFDLGLTFDQVCSFLAMGINSPNIKFRSSLSPDVPSLLTGDPGRLRQVLINLTSNAIRFTHEGEIAISCELITESGTDVELKFIIKDTGIGISREDQKIIFDSFSQVDGSTTREYGGTGLGTTISKQLVELMDGSIGLDSEVGKGSTFWFTVKIARQEETSGLSDNSQPLAPKEKESQEDQTIPDYQLKNFNILLVEDYPTNQKIAMQYLTGAGYQAHLAENGIQAVALFDQQAFDLILMDIQMPEMDGYEATRLIRAREAENQELPPTPIIAMTAHAIKGYREKCISAGMDDYLTKPFRRKHFLDTVQHWLPNGKALTKTEGEAFNEDDTGETALSEKSPFEFDKALEEFDMDKEFLKEVIDEFLETVTRQLPEIEKAVRDQDSDIISREAHAIKGGAANLCATPLSQAAHRLELIGKSGDLTDSSQVYDDLAYEFDRVKDYIATLKF